MARGRLISKSLGSSRKYHALLSEGGKLGEFCQVLFPLLVANTDDFGRMPGDAFTVKNVVLPTSRRLEGDFETALDIMGRVGLIVRYVVDKSIYLQVNKFDEHQPNLNKRTKSRYPEIPENSGIPGNFLCNIRESNLRESNPESNPEENPEPRLPARAADRLFDAFWDAYPKKKAKDDARRAWDKRRPDDALLGAMLHALRVQKQSDDWLKNKGQYIPLPATWLNGARWTDETAIDLATGAELSETARYNLAATDEAERLIEEMAHGHRG
jgi:hypothetical protein